MAISSRALLLLLLATSLASIAWADDGNSSSDPVTSISSRASCTLPEPGPETQCSFEGQSDFYGVGVRIGIYFTWLTSWIANNFLDEEVAGSLDTNAIFLLAISVTVIFNSIWGTLRIIDAVILLQLCYGFLFSVMSLWGYRTMFYRRLGAAGRSHFGGFGTHLRLILMTAISAYAVWYWFEGLEDGLIQCNKREACGGLEIFFFARVKLYGGIRTFYKIAAIVCALYYGVMTLVALLWFTIRCAKFLKLGREGWTQSFEHGDDVDTGFNQRQLSYAYIALATFNFCWMLFSAFAVEFTLNFNHMSNVLGNSGLTGPGQQLPLLIGGFSFLRIMWLIFKEYYMEREKKMEEKRNLGITPAAIRMSTGIASSPATPAAAALPEQGSYFSKIPLLAAHNGRPWAHRVLVTYLPWLTDLDFFSSPHPDGQRIEAANHEPGRKAATEMQQRSYNKSSGVEVDVESLGSRRPGSGPNREEKL